MYEFRLKYAKTTQSGHFGHTCTGTPLTCTGIGCILFGVYRYSLDLYRYRLVSTGGVPVQPCTCTCTGTASVICPNLLFLPTFYTIFLYITSPFLNTSKIIIEIIQHNFTTLELVIWNSYYKTLGENLIIQPKVHQFF